jgi:hypothetical protein
MRGEVYIMFFLCLKVTLSKKFQKCMLKLYPIERLDTIL